jgi:hypothetical protein
MANAFKGVVNLDIRDSIPDWSPYEQPKAAAGTPNILYIVLDDVGFGALGCYGGTDRDAEHRPHRGQRIAVRAVAHHSAVLTDAIVSAHRPEPHDQRNGLHQ